MQCPKCGAEVSDQSVYCHKCGERVDASESELAEQPAAEAAESANTPPESNAGAPTAKTPKERLQERTTAARNDEAEQPESDLWEGGYAGKAMLGAWVLSGVVSVVLIVLAIWIRNYYMTIGTLVVVVLLWLYQLAAMKYRQWNYHYRLTTQRFIHQTGILRRVTDRIELIDVDDITFEQRLLERLVGVGTIRISSSDRTHPELLLRGIRNVSQVAGQIDDTRRTERLRRGLHVEMV